MLDTARRAVERSSLHGSTARGGVELDAERVDASLAQTPKSFIRRWANNVIWFNLIVITMTPVISLYGLFTTSVRYPTVAFCVAYYVFNMLGYHRLWSHRAYNASWALQILLALAGVGAVQGSIKWWAKRHRVHHRYTDTDLDPYDAHRGLVWSHIGWVLFKPNSPQGTADVGDLKYNRVVVWQHKWYFTLAFLFGFVLPATIPGCFWGDWRGGFFYGAFLRLTLVHHCTFCVNSLAHWLGEATFDDKLTPRDHFLTALVTLGEGYHNFHHQFPMDYRNAVKWYQWDPTKWFIAACGKFGWASHLKMCPDGEVQKSEFTMKLKKLKEDQDKIHWPLTAKDLPIVEWETYKAESQYRPLILIAGFIHDVEDFLDQHPGGESVIRTYIGKDATSAFFGGTYDHSDAAHNLLANRRIAVLHAGVEQVGERMIPPCQRLQIVPYQRHPREGNVGNSSSL
ncbi:delta 9-fatty acid desaturase protein [Trametopsis cervina]|nr:delta 9-fatty acid desaturase protein [Trametopsis cervina]